MNRTLMTTMLGLALAVASANAEEEFVIEKYSFSWIVAEVANANVTIFKDHDSTLIFVHENRGLSINTIRLQPVDAEAVGKALGEVDHWFTEFKDSRENRRHRIKAGHCQVEFRFYPERVPRRPVGFSVHIIGTPSTIANDVFLDRGQAKAFAPHLRRARAMVAFLDGKLRF